MKRAKQKFSAHPRPRWWWEANARYGPLKVVYQIDGWPTAWGRTNGVYWHPTPRPLSELPPAVMRVPVHPFGTQEKLISFP